ncbi:MATE efflux family protein 3, chloroplastic [Hordeum vulgare]|nr:MATE efflux family protein 3, chloroplastic [Hordeum vulgare]
MTGVDPNSDGDSFGGQPPHVFGGRGDQSEVDTWLGNSSFAAQHPESEASHELATARPPSMTISAPHGRRKLPRARGGSDDDKGIEGLEKISSEDDVRQMLLHSLNEKIVNIRVVRANEPYGNNVELQAVFCSDDEDRPVAQKLKPVRNPGPTIRSHNEVEKKEKPDWLHEADEKCFSRDYGVSVKEDEPEGAYKLPSANLSLNPSLDVCFIKLTTRQQVLAATRRDGNNNIYPIAFGVVDKEDRDSWTWSLTQLRCFIGSGNKFGTYTIISDSQKGLLKA